MKSNKYFENRDKDWRHDEWKCRCPYCRNGKQFNNLKREISSIEEIEEYDWERTFRKIN